MLKNKRYIFWDWNGTLLDDARYAHQLLVTMMEARKMTPITFEQYQYFYEHPLERLYQRAGFSFKDEPFEKLAHEWHEKYLDSLESVELHEDARETLFRFKAAGIRQAILSALPHSILEREVRSRGLGGFFDHIQGAPDTRATGKIEYGQRLMKVWGAEPAQSVLIGDTSHDVEVAEELGIDCFLVARGAEHRDRLRRHNMPILLNFCQLWQVGDGMGS